VYQRVFGRLSRAELARFHDEQIPVAVACGAPLEAVPASYDDFTAYFDRVVAEDLVVTSGARDVQLATMVPPLPTPLRQLAGPVNTAVTTSLLPPSLREACGLPWGRRERRAAEAFFAAARAGRLLPTGLRQLPSSYQLHRERAMHLRPIRGAAPGSRILARREHAS
jgi:uncharacterized protein (DUF2236 family)